MFYLLSVKQAPQCPHIRRQTPGSGVFMRRLIGLTVLSLSLSCGAAFATTPAEFVSAYAGQLGQQQALKARIAQDLRNPSAGQLKECTDGSIALAGALHKDAEALKAMSLTGDLAKMGPTLVNLYESKAIQHLQYGAICSTMSKSPAGGKAYLAAAGAAPAVLAHLAATDRVIFQGMPLIAASLLPPGADVRNPQARLTITKAQRLKLVSDIDKAFKTPLPSQIGPNSDITLASAAILRAFLTDHTGSDER
jgi:hypothetical protein